MQIGTDIIGKEQSIKCSLFCKDSNLISMNELESIPNPHQHKMLFIWL